MPAQAGIQVIVHQSWIPAFAGMTDGKFRARLTVKDGPMILPFALSFVEGLRVHYGMFSKGNERRTKLIEHSAESSKQMNGKRNLTATLLRIGSVITGLLLWHFIANVVINDTSILVSPVVVVTKAYEMLVTTGELYPHLFASSQIFFWGFVLAILVGVPLGFVMALSPVVRDYVNPWMTTLYTAPRIAFAPVLLLWFGIGAGSKIAIVFLGCVFPILINSYYGMRVVNREYVELARSFRLNRWALFGKILLPASLPFILAGIRLAIGRGLTGVAIAEWFGASEGLGYLVFFAGQTLNVPTLFVGVAAFAVLGLIGFELVRRVEAFMTPWHKA